MLLPQGSFADRTPEFVPIGEIGIRDDLNSLLISPLQLVVSFQNPALNPGPIWGS